MRVYRWNICIHVCVRNSDLHLIDYVLYIFIYTGGHIEGIQVEHMYTCMCADQ